VFESLKLSTAGDGLEVKILMMPLGKDRVMSPVIFTMHLKSHLKKKNILPRSHSQRATEICQSLEYLD